MASSLPSWPDVEDTVRLLIEHGASVNAYDKNHQTPLHRLSSCDYPDDESLRLLLENGADVDVEDDEGLTPFQIASSKGESIWHREIAQLLLDHRASIVSDTL
ncbi:ankyrin [Lactarius tabidus]